MSSINGDKSRYHRLRKQKLLKRTIKATVLATRAEAATKAAPSNS